MLDVWTADRLSGRLTRQGQTAHTFTYFPDAEPDQAVSIRMPTRTTSWESKGGLHPVFDQNLPEGSLRAWFEPGRVIALTWRYCVALSRRTISFLLICISGSRLTIRP